MWNEFWNGLTGLGVRGLTAQGIGLLAAVAAFISFQQKKRTGIVIFQCVSGLLWTIHMFLLGAFFGAALNVVAALRCVIFAMRENHPFARGKIWYVIFCVMIVGLSVPSLVIDREWQAVFPLAAMILTTFSLNLDDPFRVRFFTFFSSPCWIVYNVLYLSVAGILSEIVNMTSIILGILRIDLPKMRRARREAREAAQKSGDAGV